MHSVLAVGTSGPVFNARFEHHTSRKKTIINTSACGASSFCVHVRSLIPQVNDQALKNRAQLVHMHVDVS